MNNEISFWPVFIDKILSGEKTQTIRPVKAVFSSDLRRLGGVVQIKELPGVSLQITNVAIKRLFEITEKDLANEGLGVGPNLAKFYQIWQVFYPGNSSWSLGKNPRVYVVSFKLHGR